MPARTPPAHDATFSQEGGQQEEGSIRGQEQRLGAQAEQKGDAMKLSSAFAIALLCAVPVRAQNEGAIHSEFRQEAEKVRESCSGWTVKQVGGCAVTLATEHPLHVAFGSIAP